MAETATAQADPAGSPPEEAAPPEGMDAGTEPGDGAPSATSLRPVLIKDRFAVDPKTPLPDLDSPSAKAFMAEDRRDIDRPVFALICNPGLPTRLGAMTSLRGSGIKALVGVLEWEVEFWPLIRQRTMILILERPLGGRVLQKGTFRISEYDLPRKVIEPLAGASTPPMRFSSVLLPEPLPPRRNRLSPASSTWSPDSLPAPWCGRPSVTHALPWVICRRLGTCGRRVIARRASRRQPHAAATLATRSEDTRGREAERVLMGNS